MSAMSLLEVSNLSVGFRKRKSIMKVIDDVSFSVKKGQIVGIVGESGSGKSVTALSLLRMLPQPSGEILGGSVSFCNENILQYSLKEMYKLRGNKISMIFQEPMSALNPLHTIGSQLVEAIQFHSNMGYTDALERSIDMLRKVGISDPEIRVNDYPHKFSGGMLQRVVIAMALICQPDLVIADEPTTALDVTIQAQILDLLLQLKDEMQLSILLITHDFGIVSQVCDEVIVMYAGQVVETNTVSEIFKNPRHPYTKGLLAASEIGGIERKGKLLTIPGIVPNVEEYSNGCRFKDRCGFQKSICGAKIPFELISDNQYGVRCIRHSDI